MRQSVLFIMTFLMLVLSVAASPRPLKQAKIKRYDLEGRDEGYDPYHHKPSKAYHDHPTPTPTPYDPYHGY